MVCDVDGVHAWSHCFGFQPVTVTAVLKHQAYGWSTDWFNVHWDAQDWSWCLGVDNEDWFVAPFTARDCVGAFHIPRGHANTPFAIKRARFIDSINMICKLPGVNGTIGFRSSHTC